MSTLTSVQKENIKNLVLEEVNSFKSFGAFEDYCHDNDGGDSMKTLIEEFGADSIEMDDVVDFVDEILCDYESNLTD